MALKYHKIYHHKAIRKSREEINEIGNRKTIEKSTMLRFSGLFFLKINKIEEPVH